MIFKIKFDFMRTLFWTLVLVSSTALYAQATSDEDSLTRLLSLCNDSTPCLIGKSVVFAPIFPWFQYPMDDKPFMGQLRRYERSAGELDFGLMKAAQHYSGYKADAEFHRQWFGAGLDYNSYNNGQFDQSFWSLHFVFHFMPRRHFQPKFLVGYRYIATDQHAGGGLQISFFNYDITFTRRFSMFIVNYISWIKGYTIVEGLVGIEYYVYPTIAVNPSLTYSLSSLSDLNFFSL